MLRRLVRCQALPSQRRLRSPATSLLLKNSSTLKPSFYRSYKSLSTPKDSKSKVADPKLPPNYDWKIIKSLLFYIWPEGDHSTKKRVGIALSLLVAGKLCNVQVPFFFKSIVDQLNIPQLTDTGTSLFVVAGSVLIGCINIR